MTYRAPNELNPSLKFDFDNSLTLRQILNSFNCLVNFNFRAWFWRLNWYNPDSWLWNGIAMQYFEGGFGNFTVESLILFNWQGWLLLSSSNIDWGLTSLLFLQDFFTQPDVLNSDHFSAWFHEYPCQISWLDTMSSYLF